MDVVLMRTLPGGDLVESGLCDLRAGRLSANALLVLVGAPRLRRLGLDIPDSCVAQPEHELYRVLATTGPATEAAAAHSRYNALIRRLVSFERAAECAR